MKPIHRSAPRKRAQSLGVTLVELLIAVTIGLLLTVVIAQLFLGSRQTFATTDDVSRMQDNIRYAQQLLIRTIHLTGYKSQANSVTANVFSGANIALGATNGAGTAPDEITVRYQGSGNRTSDLANCKSNNPPNCTGADGFAVDCLGVKIDAGMMAENRFNIAVGANGRNALFCHNGVNNVEVVPNVQSMQILYGEDVNADLVADRYVSPDVTPPGNVNNVVSVRISLLFETPTATSKAVADTTQTYDMLGDGSVVLGPYNDRRIRRLVTTTVNLRNRTP
ncbi:MAG: PilW family protein [Burkholderiales bacterium]|nr:PilW family protein [Burkholderiales bacterium]